MVVTDSIVTVDNSDVIRGKKVVLVEDGPTLTHGGMPYGAGKMTLELSSSLCQCCSPEFCVAHSKCWPAQAASIPVVKLALL